MLVEADFEQSRRGLSSRLEEMVGDRTVLEQTLAGIARVPSVDIPVVVVQRRDEDRARILVDRSDVKARLFVHDFEDIPGRERLRRGRRWGKDGWRGGIGDAYFVSEAGNPLAWEALYRQEKWDAALVVPGEAALVDPLLLEELARHYLDRRWGSPIVASTAPPGLAGDVFHYSMVTRLAEARATLHQVFPFRLDDPTSDPDLHKASYSFRETITGARFRVTAEGHAGLERVRGLFAALVSGDPERRPTAEAMIDYLNAHPGFASGAAPEEIQVTGLSEAVELDTVDLDAVDLRAEQERVWKRILDVPCVRDDALLTLGGLGVDPLADGRWQDRVREARDAGFFGIHVSTPGDRIDRKVAADLLSAPIDIVTIEIECPNAELAAARRLEPSFGDRQRGLDALIEEATRHSERPFVVASVTFDEESALHLESWIDDWFGRLDRVLIRGVEGPRGEKSRGSMGHFAPPERFACQRLQTQLVIDLDGRVPLCARDPFHEFPLGRLKTQPDEGERSTEVDSVPSLWQGSPLANARSLHAAGQWDQLGHCGKCLSWCRFD